MVEMSSDGRERLHVLVFNPLQVVGTIGGALRGSGQKLVFAVWVYTDLGGKGLINTRLQRECR